MSNLWGREPVMVLALVQAALAMAMGFGLHWTPQQMALVMTFVAALIGVITRTQVTPTSGATAPPTINMSKRVGAVLLACTVSASLLACGPISVKQQIDRSDRVAFESLRLFQTLESGAYHAHAPWPTAAQHQQIGAKLSQAYTLVIDVANAGLALQTGAPIPAQLTAEVGQLTTLVADIVVLAQAAPAAVKDQAAVAKQKTTALTHAVMGGK